MAIRDYWVYQGRGDVVSPWALYIVKKYDRRTLDSVILDYTLYSENIGNQTHSLSFVGLHYDTLTGYVDDIAANISEYSTVTDQDIKQLELSILNILTD